MQIFENHFLFKLNYLYWRILCTKLNNSLPIFPTIRDAFFNCISTFYFEWAASWTYRFNYFLKFFLGISALNGMCTVTCKVNLQLSLRQGILLWDMGSRYKGKTGSLTREQLQNMGCIGKTANNPQILVAPPPTYAALINVPISIEASKPHLL